MPLYEYQCDAGHRFEVIVKYSDPPIEVCPTCGSPAHKLMSSPAIQFKGTGWYITDYARKGSDTKEGKDTKSSAEGKDSKETKETKETKDSKDTKSDKGPTSDSASSSTSSTSPSTTSPGSSTSKD